MNKNLLAQASAKSFRLKATQIIIGLVVVLALVSLVVLPNQDVLLHAQLQQLINARDVEGHFWMPNMGWVGMQDKTGEEWGVGLSKNSAEGGLANVSLYEFVGYGWAPNFGWVGFNENNDNNVSTGYSVYVRADIGNPIDGEGPWPIDGFAWAPNIGWLDFDAIDDDPERQAEQPMLTLQWDGVVQNPDAPIVSARLDGYAWSPNAGWVDLSYAKIPAWRDNTNPRIIDWTAVSEEPVHSPPFYPYERGVYIEEKGDYSPFFNHNFVWVRNNVNFYLQVDSQDNQTRFQDLYISNVTTENDEVYSWKDRIKYIPGEPDDPDDNRYNGHYYEDLAAGWFQPNPAYPEGENPSAAAPISEPGQDPVPPEAWQPGDPMDPGLMPKWGSATHFSSNATGSLPRTVTKFELRTNARDAGANFACDVGTFVWGSWADRKGCRFNQVYGPDGDVGELQRVGIAIDYFEPSGTVEYEGHVLADDDHIRTDITYDLDFKYIDIESGSYRGQVSWSWDKNNWTVVDNYENNEGRDEVTRAFEFGGMGGNEGDFLYLRIEVWDNVGNKKDQTIRLVVDNTPPEGDYRAEDPKDANPNRTRFSCADLVVPPPDDDTNSVQFSNDKETWTAEIVYGSEEWPRGQELRVSKWDLHTTDESGNPLTGGNRIVYARFLDKSIPPNPVEVPYIIRGPWFEAQSGDVHANQGLGEVDCPGCSPIAPFSDETTAIWRITAGGQIVPEVTSQEDWDESDYADLGYPSPGGSVGDIEFEELWDQADGVITERDIIGEEAIDFDIHGELLKAEIRTSGTGRPLFKIGNGKQDIKIKGKGTLLVKGSVYIISDLYYEDEQVSSLRDIDSMGILTKRDLLQTPRSSQGNLLIDNSVNHLVGSYVLGLGKCLCFGTNSCQDTGRIHSAVTEKLSGGTVSEITYGTSSNEMVLNGLVIARGFDLGRYSSGSQNFLQNPSFIPRSSCPHPSITPVVTPVITPLPTATGIVTAIPRPTPVVTKVPKEDIEPTIEKGMSAGPSIDCRGISVPRPWDMVITPPIANIRFGTSDAPYKDMGACQLVVKWDDNPGANATLVQNFSIPTEVDIPENLEDGKFTISTYIKASNKLEGVVSLSVAGNDCASENINQQWRRLECTAENVNPGSEVDFRLNLSLAGLSKGGSLSIAATQAEYNAEATAWHPPYADSESYAASSEHFYYDGRAVMNTPPGFTSVSRTPWGEATAD